MVARRGNQGQNKLFSKALVACMCPNVKGWGHEYEETEDV